jgi:glucose-1-phosphate thymidylyltransferase
MKGVVLHGGSGTRLRPLTHTGPKQLIPIANKPVSQYAVEDLLACGIKDIAFVLGDTHPEKVKDRYGDGSRFGAKFTYILQGEPRGIAQAIGLCRDFVHNSPFIVYLGDNLIKGGITEYAHGFQETNADAMILLAKVKDPSRFGVARLDKNGRIIGLEEKPKNPASNLALTGIYLFRPSIFRMIEKLKPSWRNELEITEAIHLLLQGNGRVDYHIVEGWWKDTGTPEDILESNRLVLDELDPMMEGIAEDEDSIQGRVAVGRGSRISKGATVRGPCIVGEGTMLEKGVYVGPYTSIGNNVLVKRGEIEDSIVMDNCTIDIPYRITSSIIGQHTTITGKNHDSPRGLKMILGENCQVTL